MNLCYQQAGMVPINTYFCRLDVKSCQSLVVIHVCKVFISLDEKFVYWNCLQGQKILEICLCLLKLDLFWMPQP